MLNTLVAPGVAVTAAVPELIVRHMHADSKSATSVLHVIALTFWSFCFFGVVLFGLCLLLVAVVGGAHADPLDWSLDLVRIQKWPVLLRLAFGVGLLAAMV